MPIPDQSVLWLKWILDKLSVLAVEDSELRLGLSSIVCRMKELQLENFQLRELLRFQIPFQERFEVLQLENALLYSSLLSQGLWTSTKENMSHDEGRSKGSVSDRSTERSCMSECAACGATYCSNEQSSPPSRRYGKLCQRCDGTHLVTP